MVDITGTVNINTAPATRALQAAARSFEQVEKAGKNVTTAQRAAMTAMTNSASKLSAENRKVAESFAKIRQAAIDAERAQKRADLAADTNRRNARATTTANVGLTTARTEEVVNRTVKYSEDSSAKVALSQARAITEEFRRQAIASEAASRNESRALRDQLALRKQNLSEANALRRSQEGGNGGLQEARYVLGDLARGITVVSAGLLALPIAAGKIAIDWEKNFANVVRTVGVTGDSVDRLKGQFVSLVTTMPVSFEQLSEIGTLAGQLGIAETQIGAFTKTVAMFSSATGVSIEESATAFGRLNSLVPDVRGNFTALGDAILKVGVNSVATEQSIIRITTQIAAVASGAGFSSKEIIGLSGALASVGVPPELSRGVTTRVFGDITEAVAKGGVALEKWGGTINMTGQEFREAWNEDASGTFLKFMESIRKSGGGAALVLNDLGITSVRDVPILMRLAGAADSTGKAGNLLAESINNANNSAGEMARQYGVTSSTVAAKLQVFVQNIQALGDAVGKLALGTFGDVLDDWTLGLQDLGNSLNDNAKLFGTLEIGMTNGELLALGATITAAIGVVGLLFAGLVKLAQGVVTLRVVMMTMPSILGAFGASATVASASTATLGNSMGAATTKATLFQGAIKGITTSLPIIGAMAAAAVGGIILINNAFDDASSGAQEAAAAVQSYGNDVLASLDALHGGGIKTEGYDLFGDTASLQKGLDTLEKASNGGFGFANFGAGLEDMSTLNDANSALDELNKGYKTLISEGNGDRVIKQVRDLADAGKLTDSQLSRLIYNTDLNGYFKGLLREGGIELTEQNLLKLARGGLDAVGISAEDATANMSVFEEQLAASAEATQASIDGLASTSAAFIDFGESIKGAFDEESGLFNLDTFMESIRRGAQEQVDFQQNLGKLAAMGLDTGFLDYLVEQGPKSAELIKGFIANPAAFQEAQEIWRKGGEQSSAEWAGGFKTKVDLAAEVGVAFGADVGNNFMNTLNTTSQEQLPGIMDNMQQLLLMKKVFPQASMEQLQATLDVGIPENVNRAQLVMNYMKLHPQATTEDVTALLANDLPLIIGEQQFFLDYMKLHPKATLEEVQLAMSREVPQIRQQGQNILDGNPLAPSVTTDNAERVLYDFVNRRRTITVDVQTNNPTSVDLSNPSLGPGAATGGAIYGPGTGTSDSIPYMLSNGEHVLTASEVSKLGGQNAVYQLRNAIKSGSFGRAAGGSSFGSQQSGAMRSGSSHVVASVDAASLLAIATRFAERPVILKVGMDQFGAIVSKAGANSNFLGR